MVYCVGLIGNLASGKSTVARYFAALGVDVINADDIAKELTTPFQPAFDSIVAHFGKSILTDAGDINRRQLRQLIFSQERERLWLEQLLHPLIRKRIEERINTTQSPYCIIEIPLMPARTNYPYLNRVLFIQATAEQQIARFIIRDKGSKKEEAQAILATQAQADTLRALADDVLLNTGSLEELQKAIKALHLAYLEYALGT